MSFFKRLTNLGKGVWKVNMGPRDPDEERRIQVLQAELAEREARTPVAARPAARAPGTAARAEDPEALLEARLDQLATELREGRLSREEYDLQCEAAISKASGAEADRSPDGSIKRTL